PWPAPRAPGSARRDPPRPDSPWPDPPAPDSARPELPPLVAVAHGSRDPRGVATIEELIDLVRARAACYGLAGLPVSGAYLGHATPSPGQVLSALPSGPVVVLPLLLTGAYHSLTDLP